MIACAVSTSLGSHDIMQNVSKPGNHDYHTNKSNFNPSTLAMAMPWLVTSGQLVLQWQEPRFVWKMFVSPSLHGRVLF